jgi:hypothetical protein
MLPEIRRRGGVGSPPGEPPFLEGGQFVREFGLGRVHDHGPPFSQDGKVRESPSNRSSSPFERGNLAKHSMKNPKENNQM